ncbi:MAG: hypothetical protein P1V20_21685 [Verrucomicrobiales bacterium]|nr:hypothetical protein [Verrucomicrobiales bacterium]
MGTSDKQEAEKLIAAENEALNDPTFGLYMAQAYLNATDPLASSRTWSNVINEFSKVGGTSTVERKKRVFESPEFSHIKDKPLLKTVAEDLYLVLDTDKTSVFTYLIQIQNFALDMGWIPKAVIPRKRFPKPPKKRDTRSITYSEHMRILEAENCPERRRYYHLLWLIGASQSDGAALTHKNIDLIRELISYDRCKTGQGCIMKISEDLRALLDELPKDGLLFPGIQNGGANYRASEFRRRCRLLKIKGVSLHSYRYAWAERAFEAGIPERFAMAALGHGSKAVHRAYAKAAHVVCPALPSIAPSELD